MQAASELPPTVVPKVKGGPQGIASYITRGQNTKGDIRLQETDRRTANTDLLTFRSGATTKEILRNLSKTSPDLSASLNAYIRMVVTRGFAAVARNEDGTANPQATQATQALLNRFNYLGDYTDGFSGMSSIHALAESLTVQLRVNGSCSMELVLDKARLPYRLQPISTTQVFFVDDGSAAVKPEQRVAGRTIDLDIPTFFYEAIDQDLLEAYSSSPMEAAIQPTLADAEFTNDVRRIIKKALHPRFDAAVAFEDFKKNLPLDIQGDAEKTKAFQDAFIQAIADVVNGLDVDDALVHFDNVKFDYINNGNVSLDREYDTLQGMMNSKMATGSKSPPTVLGHGTGSQNIASTETLLFMRYCEGVQLKLNSIISRALTLGVRLLGHDVFVDFSFDRIDLRPESELEAFRSMRQSRILDLLSLGLYSDDEASILLTGRLPPAGFKTLTGTMFRGSKAADPAENPTSNTSTFGKATAPETPEQAKGPPVKRVK
jgi:hypothetical protein